MPLQSLMQIPHKPMDEYLDILTPQGQPTGKTALKQQIHKNGWYHNTVHVWLYTNTGKILLQQRSHKKPIYPLLWDVSAAGHVDAGETLINAAIRETHEEIGLQLQAQHLHKIGTHLHKSIYNNGAIKDFEFHHVYISQLQHQLHQLTPQPNEVEALKLVSIPEFKSLLNNSATNNHFVASNYNYYSFVLKHITKQLK